MRDHRIRVTCHTLSKRTALISSVTGSSFELSHSFSEPSPAPHEPYYANSGPPPVPPHQHFPQQWPPSSTNQSYINSKPATFYPALSHQFPQQQLPSPAPSNSHSSHHQTGPTNMYGQPHPPSIAPHEYPPPPPSSNGGVLGSVATYAQPQYPYRLPQHAGPQQRNSGSSGNTAYYAPPHYPPLASHEPESQKFGPPPPTGQVSPRSFHTGVKRDREEASTALPNGHSEERGRKRAVVGLAGAT